MDETEFTKRPSITDEKLIVAAMTYLKYHDPSNATREDAVSLLAFMQTAAKEVSTITSEEGFNAYYDAYKEEQSKK